MQRKETNVGKGLGKTTGWTHRLTLQRRGVKMMNAIEYRKIDDAGLHITVNGKPDILEVDTVIICAGQNLCANCMMRWKPKAHLSNWSAARLRQPNWTRRQRLSKLASWRRKSSQEKAAILLPSQYSTVRPDRRRDGRGWRYILLTSSYRP